MKTKAIIQNLIVLFIISISTSCLYAAVIKVGNGDDGTDLEGFSKVEQGILIDTKYKAILKLNALNVQGVPGLGSLIPELEHSTIYLAKKDNQDNSGEVYARTFATPHSPTRFFPKALKLDEEQLIALHVHEALHRSLPDAFKEDEYKVTQLTVAITSPESNFDRINIIMQKFTQTDTQVKNTEAQITGQQKTKIEIPEDAKIKRPTKLSYSYQVFQKSESLVAPQIKSMTSIQSDMYAFGTDEQPIGLGLGIHILNRTEKNQLGPLSLSGKARVWTVRGFDVGFWGTASLNTLSAEELKNSPFGRDLYSGGISLEKLEKYFYLENTIGFTLPSNSEQKLGNIKYTHEFGTQYSAQIHTGGKINTSFGYFRLGGMGEILLSDYYRVKSKGFEGYDSGRYQIVSAGPEFTYGYKALELKIFSKTIISATNDENFDSIANILGEGSGQGSTGASLTFQF